MSAAPRAGSRFAETEPLSVSSPPRDGELRPDRGCLAVPVRSPGGGTLVAGLALAGPPHRVAEPNDELVALLREHAERLSPLLA